MSLTKKPIIVLAILLSLLVLGTAPIRNFYSSGLTYHNLEDVKAISGRIATLRVEADKPGKAGIEQDILIQTADQGNLTLEIINWYYGIESGLGIGYVLYGESGHIQSERLRAEIGTVYHYRVSIDANGIYLEILDGDTTVVSLVYGCTARAILETASFLEYWRYPQPGDFFYYAYVTVDSPQGLQHHKDFYYAFDGLPWEAGPQFGMYFMHHNWDGNYFDKGEVDDRERYSGDI